MATNYSSCKTLEDRLERVGVKVMRIHRAFQWCQEGQDTSIAHYIWAGELILLAVANKTLPVPINYGYRQSFIRYYNNIITLLFSIVAVASHA